MTQIIHTFQVRHPGCDVTFTHTGFELGPVVSREERVLLVAEDDPLATRDSISYEEIADAVSDVPAFRREIVDAFIPPVTPSGRVLRRVANASVDAAMMRVALGIQVHPTVRSFVEHHSHPGVTSVPIDDLHPRPVSCGCPPIARPSSRRSSAPPRMCSPPPSWAPIAYQHYTMR